MIQPLQSEFYIAPDASILQRLHFIFSRALIITRREVRDNLTDWRILTPIFSMTVIIPLLLLGGINLSHGLLANLEPGTLDKKILPFSVLAVAFFPTSFSLVIALEVFVGEKERNSLEALLSAPLTDLELYLGKFFAALIPPVLASTLGMAVFISAVVLTGNPWPTDALTLLQFWLLSMTEAFVMVAGAVVVSSHATSVRGANILASFIILPMSVVVQVEAVVILSDQKGILWLLLLALLAIFTLLMRLGVNIFNREEIVAREGDTLNPKQIARNFAGFFKRTPRESLTMQKTNLSRFSIIRLYRRDIPQILYYNRIIIGLVTLVMLAGIILGWWLSTWDVIQSLLANLNGGSMIQAAGSANPICQPGYVPSGQIVDLPTDWWGIFVNNAKTILVSGGIGLVTLGLGSIISPLISIGLLGFIGGILISSGVNPTLPGIGFVLPHGILEFPALIIATSIALRMGSAFIAPPKGFSVGRSFQLGVADYVKIMALVIPMLFVAALIEGNLTIPLGCWITGGHM
jgi:uncharacterized membrane protein SpoIIM required for sporulation